MTLARTLLTRIIVPAIANAGKGGKGFEVTATQSGGHKIREIMDRAERQRRARLKVGIFSDSEYEDGEKVANVGAIQEFGSPEAHIPERPYFRQAVAEIERDLPKQMRGIIDPTTMEISERNAARIGSYAAGVIRDRIRALKSPPNAPYTLTRKSGANPLQDTGELENAVDWERER